MDTVYSSQRSSFSFSQPFIKIQKLQVDFVFYLYKKTQTKPQTKNPKTKTKTTKKIFALSKLLSMYF